MHLTSPVSPYRLGVLACALALLLTMTACGGGDESEPTPEPSPTAAQAVEPTATAKAEPEPTATASPEPTPTPYSPPPTVAAPLYEPPAAPTTTPPEEPTPTEQPAEPTPEVDVPDSSGEVTTSLISSTLTDWATAEFDIGYTYVTEAGYHIVNSSPDGIEIWSRSEQSDMANIVASLDVRMISDTPDSYACLMVRVDPVDWAYGYTLCMNGYQESFAEFEYVDAEGVRQYERLVEIVAREGTLPATEWNTLTIVANGQDLGFFVNDEMLDVAVHGSVETGAVSFFMYNFSETPAEWVFTNLEVWAIE